MIKYGQLTSLPNKTTKDSFSFQISTFQVFAIHPYLHRKHHCLIFSLYFYSYSQMDRISNKDKVTVCLQLIANRKSKYIINEHQT